MKKALICVLAVMTAATFASCGEAEQQTETTAPVTVEITSEEVTKISLPNVKIQEETISKSKKQSATDPTEPTATEESTSPKTKKKKKKKTQAATTEPPTQGQTKAGTHISVTEPSLGSFSAEDLTFITDGAYIYLDDEIDDVIALLGDDNSVSELSDTEFEYEYADLTVTTYVKKGKEKVDSITVTSDKIPTPKGAKVGMYGTWLKRVYGEATKSSDTLYAYISGKSSLEFSVENNIVKSYTYRLKH